LGIQACKECKNPVSSRADNCPHCGAPVLANKKVGFFSGVLILFGVLCLVFVLLTVLGIGP